MANGGIVCEDGSLCDSRGLDVRCRPICLDADADCGIGQTCSRLINQPLMMGVCTGCVDTDLDGDCDATDCAPGDPEQGANADEICDDGIDQDCDTRIDEGCVGPDMQVADMGTPEDAAVMDADAAWTPDLGVVDMQMDPPDALADAQVPPMVIERTVRRNDGCVAMPGNAAGWGGVWALGLVGLITVRRRRAISRPRGPSPS